MSMIALQTVVARFCLDREFRQSFLSDSAKAMEPFELTSKELAALRALDLEALQEYAGSLLAKRMGVIKKWLPLSFLVLETQLPSSQLHRLLHHYGLENIRDNDELAGEWVRGESDRFCNYLRELVSTGEIQMPAFAEVLEFEALRFSMASDPEVSQSALEFSAANNLKDLSLTAAFRASVRPKLGKHARIRSFQYDMAQLISYLEEYETVPPLEARPTWILFFKRPHTMRVNTSTINLPLKDFLEFCDGSQTIDSIISVITTRHAAPLALTEEELMEDCLSVLEQLYEAGVVTLIGTEAGDWNQSSLSGRRLPDELSGR